MRGEELSDIYIALPRGDRCFNAARSETRHSDYAARNTQHEHESNYSEAEHVIT
jgi:hypothetical protein